MVAPPASLEGKALLKLLDDGEWHPLDEITRALCATIAPGKALRRYEERESNRTKHRGERVTAELTDDEKIASGQRTLANVTINSYKKRYVEIAEDDDGQRMVRKRTDAPASNLPKITEEVPAPGEPPLEIPPDGGFSPPQQGGECPECGMYIVNWLQHAEWHAEAASSGPAADVAFLSEKQLRAIVREEIQSALDQFQKGMQSWLVDQFDQLGAAFQPRRPADPRLPPSLTAGFRTQYRGGN